MLFPWIGAIILALALFEPIGFDKVDYCGNDTTRDAAGESHSIDEIRGEITPCITIEYRYD